MDQESNTLFSSYRRWQKDGFIEKQGVIIASDRQQEWLIPWWWENYSRHNSHSVAIVDLGMSEEMRKWCEARGALIPLFVPDIFVASRSEMAPDLAALWEEKFGKLFWDSRNAWFKKPMACLRSPFEISLWLDLDCEVRGSLNVLFESYGHSLSMVRYEDPHASYPIYNSGVIVFKHGIPVFEQWADLAIEENHFFRGDEDVLCRILQQEKIVQLPAIYNWSRFLNENPEAVVVHWHGSHGKEVIRHQIMTSNLQSLNLIDCSN